MGGEGAMMAMINSLKNNSRRKKHSQFDKDKLGSYGDGEKLEFNFPEITPEVLRNIRDRLQKEQRQSRVRNCFLFFLIAVGLILIVIY